MLAVNLSCLIEKKKRGSGGETEWEEEGMRSISLFPSSSGWSMRVGSQTSSIIYPKEEIPFFGSFVKGKC